MSERDREIENYQTLAKYKQPMILPFSNGALMVILLANLIGGFRPAAFARPLTPLSLRGGSSLSSSSSSSSSSPQTAGASATHPNLLPLQEKLSEHKLDAYLLPSTDPHLTEYPPSIYSHLPYVSRFSGSAGCAVVTPRGSGCKSFLVTDGRYELQVRVRVRVRGGNIGRG